LLPVLSVEDIYVEFATGGTTIQAVRGVSLTVDRGETLGIVGESGSGKSVTALSILRLVARPGRITRGRVMFEGSDLLQMGERELRKVRGARIAMVFQDPLTSLNPTLTIGNQIVETICEHRPTPAGEAWREAEDLLRQVHMTLPEQRLRQYPFELSGGMRQRAMIAMAFSCRPAVLIADEPTTALDVTVQAQILDLMDEIRKDLGTSVILITHDLGVVAERCDHVAVMYAGQIVEYAPVKELFESPKHPYTQAMLAALPDWRRPRTEGPLPALPGQPPDMKNVPDGCPFAARCPSAMDVCVKRVPAQTIVGSADVSGGDGSRYVRCLLYEDGSSIGY